jgi:MFS family permease
MFAIMAVAGYLLFNAADTAFEHYALSLIEGTAGGFAYVNGYSLAQRSVKASQVARVSGFYYAAATLPAAVSGYAMAKLVEVFGWSTGATLMMTLLMIVPIVISLFVDTTKVTGRGRRRTQGARLWT